MAAAYLEERSVDVQRRDAYTYATTADGVETLKKEFDAAKAAGLNATWTIETELPYPVRGALVLPDQAQFHPMEVLDALATELRQHGGVVVEGVRVTGASFRSPLTVETDHGDIRAERLIFGHRRSGAGPRRILRKTQPNAFLRCVLPGPRSPFLHPPRHVYQRRGTHPKPTHRTIG